VQPDEPASTCSGPAAAYTHTTLQCLSCSSCPYCFDGANPKQEPGPNQRPFLLIRAQPLSCNTSASAASASATAAAAGSAAAAALRMDPQPAPEPNACPTAYCAATSANPAVPLLLLLHSQLLLPVHHPATVWTIAQGARSPINASRKSQPISSPTTTRPTTKDTTILHMSAKGTHANLQCLCSCRCCCCSRVLLRPLLLLPLHHPATLGTMRRRCKGPTGSNASR
jgi:hypothetical protein